MRLPILLAIAFAGGLVFWLDSVGRAAGAW